MKTKRFTVIAMLGGLSVAVVAGGLVERHEHMEVSGYPFSPTIGRPVVEATSSAGTWAPSATGTLES